MSELKIRLDQALVKKGLVSTRSQAENYIKLGSVKVSGRVVNKSGFLVSEQDKIELSSSEQYVSRAGLKLASVAKALRLDFRGKTVLDVGSSTGGFTDFALQGGAEKVIAVDVGTDQLHPSLRTNPKVELHEQTDIRGFNTNDKIGLVLADVSFISLREILPSIANLADRQTLIVAMVKPQFEAGADMKHKGVIKNEKMRRQILQEFEDWTKNLLVIVNKSDSEITGVKGNRERFYLLRRVETVR